MININPSKNFAKETRPNWKKEAYNRDFATSKHARKFGTSGTDPDDRTTEFWECIYEDMKDIYNDGDNEW